MLEHQKDPTQPTDAYRTSNLDGTRLPSPWLDWETKLARITEAISSGELALNSEGTSATGSFSIGDGCREHCKSSYWGTLDGLEVRISTKWVETSDPEPTCYFSTKISVGADSILYNWEGTSFYALSIGISIGTDSISCTFRRRSRTDSDHCWMIDYGAAGTPDRLVFGNFEEGFFPADVSGGQKLSELVNTIESAERTAEETVRPKEQSKQVQLASPEENLILAELLTKHDEVNWTKNEHHSSYSSLRYHSAPYGYSRELSEGSRCEFRCSFRGLDICVGRFGESEMFPDQKAETLPEQTEKLIYQVLFYSRETGAFSKGSPESAQALFEKVLSTRRAD